MEPEGIEKIDEKSQYSMATVNRFLQLVGLSQPIDYIFMEYAMHQNREAIAKNKSPLHFLFHVVMSEDDETKRGFPFSTFLQLVNHRYHDSITENGESDFKNVQRYIIYNFCPSDKWDSRPIAPFTDFHLYFLDVLKPMVNQTAEELYQIIDIKRGETFFLLFGDHSVNEFISVLFVMQHKIVVFHVMKPKILDDEFTYTCKWVSTSIPTISKSQHEYAIFDLPNGNLVLSDEGVKTRKQQWQEAFGDPDLMDQVSSEETKGMSLTQLNYPDEPECQGCS